MNAKIKVLVLMALSCALLILSFPKHDRWFLAWTALVPLMFALDGQTPKRAFIVSFLCGLIFFWGTLYWFIYVDLLVAFLGAPLLMLYLALYFGLFGLGYCFLQKRNSLEKLFFLPSVWVVLEFVRAHLFSGFDWVSLGHSQAENLLLIQIADMTGVYGVSFLVVMGNVTVKEFLTSCFIKGQKKDFLLVLFLGLTIGASIIYGYLKMHHPLSSATQIGIKMSVVQGNIEQELKWYKPAWDDILEKHVFLTKKVLSDRPDLIIWPETAFPGFLWDDKAQFEKIRSFIEEVQTPLLFGAVTKKGDYYYNSAVLLSKEGRVVKQYDKRHLVPFGEYVPFRFLFPFLANVIGDFTAGREWTLFSAPNKEYQYAVLICFEDTVARLTRRFVQKGANILINITNDAWFGDSNEPFIHLQNAVFRAVENRRPLVRAANTGVSILIDPLGRRSQAVFDRGKSVFISGSRTIVLSSAHKTLTFYTRYGDVFVYSCMVLIAWAFGGAGFRNLCFFLRKIRK